MELFAFEAGMSEARALLNQLLEGGEDALASLIAIRSSEELYLDFKRSADQGKGASLHERDRENLAKAISGFGNSAGGLIVWGVDCPSPREGREDKAGERLPLADAQRFKSLLDGAVGSSTIPPHREVENHVIARLSDGSGYVATLIPASDSAPMHAVKTGLYHMRVGSAFIRIPHSVLAAMFGRRPTPHLAIRCLKFSMTPNSNRPNDTPGFNLNVSIEVVNEGLGIARDLYATLRQDSLPSAGTPLHVGSPDDPRMESMRSLTFGYSIVSKPGCRFPPGDSVRVFSVSAKLLQPVSKDLEILVSAGCENGPPVYVHLRQSKAVLEDLLEVALRGEGFSPALAKRAFGLSDPPDSTESA